MVYTAHGPFSNGIAPAIDQTVMNDIDNCLTGNLGLAKVLLSTGSIARIAQFNGTGSGLFNHNLGAVPDLCLIGYAGNFASPATAITWWTPNSTQVNVNAAAVYWVGLALKFTP